MPDQLPLVQSVQRAELFASERKEALPGSQSVQIVASAYEYLPGAHEMQAEAPSSLEKNPPTQYLQTPELSAAMIVTASGPSGLITTMFLVSVPIAAEALPTGQLMHSVAPTWMAH